MSFHQDGDGHDHGQEKTKGCPACGQQHNTDGSCDCSCEK